MNYKAGDVVWYQGKKEVIEFTLSNWVIMYHVAYGCVYSELKPVIRCYAVLGV